MYILRLFEAAAHNIYSVCLFSELQTFFHVLKIRNIPLNTKQNLRLNRTVISNRKEEVHRLQFFFWLKYYNLP